MAKKRTAKRATQAEINYAQMLYCEKRMTPEAISEITDRDIKTIYAWRDKFNWNSTKELFATSPTELKSILMKEATRIAKGEKRTDENGKEVAGINADALSKVMKAYDYMNQRTSPEVIHDVFIEFDNFMVTVDPKLAIEFTKYHTIFLQQRISQEQ